MRGFVQGVINMTSTAVKFKARIIVEDGGTKEIEVWDDELSPFDGAKRPIRDRAKEHLSECYSEKDLRELLELPAEGNYEVLIEGMLTGHMVGWETQEWDEDLDITSIKSQKIPNDWYKEDFGLELHDQNDE